MGSGVSKSEAVANIHVLIIGGGYAGIQVTSWCLQSALMIIRRLLSLKRRRSVSLLSTQKNISTTVSGRFELRSILVYMSFIMTMKMGIEFVLKNIKTTRKTNKQRLFLIRVHGKDSNPIPGSLWGPVRPRLHPVPGRGEPESSS